jgi:hypothetical protein
MNPTAKRVRSALLKIDGVLESPGVFGEGDGFWVNGKQMGNWRGDAEIELRLTRPVIRVHQDRLRVDHRVHIRGSSDWLTVTFESNKDVPFVAELGELAAAAHRAGPGMAAKPPPTGADLERRRRFH